MRQHSWRKEPRFRAVVLVSTLDLLFLNGCTSMFLPLCRWSCCYPPAGAIATVTRYDCALEVKPTFPRLRFRCGPLSRFCATHATNLAQDGCLADCLPRASAP